MRHGINIRFHVHSTLNFSSSPFCFSCFFVCMVETMSAHNLFEHLKTSGRLRGEKSVDGFESFERFVCMYWVQTWSFRCICSPWNYMLTKVLDWKVWMETNLCCVFFYWPFKLAHRWYFVFAQTIQCGPLLISQPLLFSGAKLVSSNNTEKETAASTEKCLMLSFNS